MSISIRSDHNDKCHLEIHVVSGRHRTRRRGVLPENTCLGAAAQVRAIEKSIAAVSTSGRWLWLSSNQRLSTPAVEGESPKLGTLPSDRRTARRHSQTSSAFENGGAIVVT
ncbi:hypothetical protein TNCV_2911261 [Trichonephila clavipes]|nr:hypothetical protein TNCV_2911261 [Trichonephila clavipes]